MRRIAVIVSIVLVISACSSRSDDDGPPSAPAEPTAGEATVTVSVVAGDEPADDVTLLGADALACDDAGRPCSWSDADPAVFAATHEIGQGALDRYAAGESLVDIAIDLAADPRMAGLIVDELAIVFRLEGGLATWVLADEVVEGVRSGGGPAPDAPVRLIAAYDVVGEDPESKSALVISPFLWQFTDDDEALEVAAMYEDARGYEGNVTLLTNTTEEQQVDINAFLGWGAYDVVHLSTHGAQVCPAGQACQTLLAVGKRYFEGVIEDGLTIAYSSLGASWGVDNKWFAENYKAGLPDTLVVLSGCQTAKGTELVATFGSGAVFAWTNSVLAPAARGASLELHRTLIETGATSRPRGRQGGRPRRQHV